jgi:hypothetical protein
MEAVLSPETPANFYQFTLHVIPDCKSHHSQPCKNFKTRNLQLQPSDRPSKLFTEFDVQLKSSVLWDIRTCSPLKIDRRSGGTRGFHLQGRKISREKETNVK